MPAAPRGTAPIGLNQRPSGPNSARYPVSNKRSSICYAPRTKCSLRAPIRSAPRFTPDRQRSTIKRP